MNFVAWFANVLIGTFGFESDMAIGLSVAAGAIVLFTMFALFSVSVVTFMTKMGWIEE